MAAAAAAAALAAPESAALAVADTSRYRCRHIGADRYKIEETEVWLCRACGNLNHDKKELCNMKVCEAERGFPGPYRAPPPGTHVIDFCGERKEWKCEHCTASVNKRFIACTTVSCRAWRPCAVLLPDEIDPTVVPDSSPQALPPPPAETFTVEPPNTPSLSLSGVFSATDAQMARFDRRPSANDSTRRLSASGGMSLSGPMRSFPSSGTQPQQLQQQHPQQQLLAPAMPGQMVALVQAPPPATGSGGFFAPHGSVPAAAAAAAPGGGPFFYLPQPPAQAQQVPMNMMVHPQMMPGTVVLVQQHQQPPFVATNPMQAMQHHAVHHALPPHHHQVFAPQVPPQHYFSQQSHHQLQ